MTSPTTVVIAIIMIVVVIIMIMVIVMIIIVVVPDEIFVLNVDFQRRSINHGASIFLVFQHREIAIAVNDLDLSSVGIDHLDLGLGQPALNLDLGCTGIFVDDAIGIQIIEFRHRGRSRDADDCGGREKQFFHNSAPVLGMCGTPRHPITSTAIVARQ